MWKKCRCCQAKRKEEWELGCGACAVVWEIRQVNKEMYERAKYDGVTENGEK